jgi:hypothetical protein
MSCMDKLPAHHPGIADLKLHSSRKRKREYDLLDLFLASPPLLHELLLHVAEDRYQASFMGPSNPGPAQKSEHH